MARRKQNWSLDEILKMERIIKSYPDKNKGIKTAAKYFKVSEGAISRRYSKYLKGIDVPTQSDSAQIAQKVSAIRDSAKKARGGKPVGAKSWSKAEISTLKSIMNSVADKYEGFRKASEVINRSPLAVETMYRKCSKRQRNKRSSAVKKIPNFVPLIQNPIDTRRSLTFDIKEVNVDLLSQKLTIYY